MSRQRKADLLLVLATGFWGVSYFLLDLCLTELPPLTLNAFRFLTAFFVLGAIFFRKLRSISRRTLLASIPIGLCLVLTYIGCTYGVLYTSLSNAGFICALPVVVTPLLEWLFLRKRPDRRLAVALVLCTVGMGLMTLNGALRPALGDIICLLCAVAYAGDLVLTDRAVHDPQVNALQLGILQLGGGLRDAGAGLPAGEALPATDHCRVGSGPVSGSVLLRRGLRHPDGAAAVHLRQPCGADLHAGAGVLCHRGVFLCP